MIRGSISLLIVGVIMLGGLALYVTRPPAVMAYLPAGLAAMLDDKGFAGRGGAVPGSGQTAAEYLEDGADGLIARGPVAALAGNRPVYISDAITGHATDVGDDIPAEITTIRPISGCRLTPVLAGTTVGHVTAASGGPKLPIYTYNDLDLAAAVQSLVNSYRETGSDRVATPEALAFEAFDVAVTETKVPVYLVLEGGSAKRIWNIHLAPGARIERVVLLGGSYVGVANLDPVVPVEVLPSAALAECGIVPAYPLNAGNRAFELLKSGSAAEKVRTEADLAELQDRITAYNTWFRDSFGVLADETRAGFDGGTVAVVGPVPGEALPKAPYASINGARIRMTQDSYFEIRGQVPAGEDFAGRVTAIATAFAFGDLTTLRQGGAY